MIAIPSEARCKSAALLIVFLITGGGTVHAQNMCAGPESWKGDLTAISAGDWNAARAAHLLERAGFGDTPEGVSALAARDPAVVVKDLVQPQHIDNSELKSFDESGVFDESLDPFPPSRPAATDLAKKNGEALGVKVKPSGNRRMQEVANRFFYWLRASRLETRRVAYWWANRMLATKRPLEEKMALFWHGHFATSEDKVRDYRKMLNQVQLFQAKGLGDFRTLLIGVAQDPAMLAYLDAGVNVKGAPNENFAREIMELFTMGVGNYQEKDIREAARAFTGWNFKGVQFSFDQGKHDTSDKTFLDETGNFDGIDVIDIILKQPVTAEFVADKIYRYFVRDDVQLEMKQALGKILRDNKYALAPLLQTIFLSRDFYASVSCGTHIKSPVELIVSTYKKLGLQSVPGVPDFNESTEALGQLLLWPPTVAGWSQGKSWITPGLLIERGNFVRDVVFPSIAFMPPDRYPIGSFSQILPVGEGLAKGLDIANATSAGYGDGAGAGMAMSNMMADRDEDFNTRYASYRGWQMAIERVKPQPRDTAQLELAKLVTAAKLKTPSEVVDYFIARMFAVPPSAGARANLAKFLEGELGTSDIPAAETYMEESLRKLLHVILSQPEYQLG